MKKSVKMSLNKRIGMIVLTAMLPMLLLMIYLMYTLNATNHAFDKVANSVTYANRYALEFKQRMDYSMYFAVIRGQRADELIDGETTVNGIRIVNPYDYINELRSACEEMAKIATVNSNKTLPVRMSHTLNSLEKCTKEVDDNIEASGNYNENLELLDKNIYSLTEILEGGIQDYINAENANFALVRKQMIEESVKAFRICIAAVLLTAAAAAVLSVKASKSVTKPIKKLCDMTNKVAKGDFSVKTKMQAVDEISVLTDSFNDMTREIGMLVEDIKTQQDNLRITESKLMQAQINPHFLYNTLDTIVWLAEEKQNAEVVKMVTALSEFFRTTLSKGRDYITVKEEESHIRSYLEIQKFRYQDIMDYEIEIEEELYHCIIPKLTLQPIIENALYHGIKNKRGKGMIRITGKKEGNQMIFKVIDNGKGMNEETLEKLRKSIQGTESGGSEGGFGLANVNQRIRYYYGNDCGVLLDSTENTGTEATVIIECKNIPPFS